MIEFGIKSVGLGNTAKDSKVSAAADALRKLVEKFNVDPSTYDFLNDNSNKECLQKVNTSSSDKNYKL